MIDWAPWLETAAPWIESPGSHRGIVISSRLRLARNLSNRRFRRALSAEEREQLVRELLPAIVASQLWPDPLVSSMDELNQSQRLFLVERHLASNELVTGGSQAGIVLRRDGLASVMVNEEDHLRLQVLRAGLAIEDCLGEAVAMDEHLGAVFGWAFHPRYGFLTSCPTNLGTGMRASVMLHLPGLAESKELPRMLRGLGKLQLTARGMNGEGSEASGHIYQVSNQRTLGQSEEDIVGGLQEAIADIVAYEIATRQALSEARSLHLEDRIWRAWGILTCARSLGSSEAIEHLSWLRLGLDLGIINAALWPTIDHLLITTQRAHLQLRDPTALDARARDGLRAGIMRQALGASSGL